MTNKFTKLSEVEESDPIWWWRGKVPLGAATLVEATTATYKSTAVSDWVARATSNQLMPDGTVCEAPGGVVWVAYEESASTRMKSRFLLQGGDATKFIDLSHVGKLPFELPTHINELIEAICEVHATVVVIDPLTGMSSPKLRIFGYQASYQLMLSINGVADALGVAVIVINHTARYQKPGLQTGANSMGFTNACRSKLVMYPNENNTDEIIVQQVKSSNGEITPDLVFTKPQDGASITYIEGLTPAQEKINHQIIAESNEKVVLKILAACPTTPRSPSWIAQESRNIKQPISHEAVRQLCSRLSRDGKIAKVGYGDYQDYKGASK